MEDNPIVTKSFAFALRIVKLSRYLADEHKEFTLSRELLSAGTNIGKHVKEAQSGETRESFPLYMAKALRRADETEYWLQLIQSAKFTKARIGCSTFVQHHDYTRDSWNLRKFEMIQPVSSHSR